MYTRFLTTSIQLLCGIFSWTGTGIRISKTDDDDDDDDDDDVV
jgi:hypothetical protein